MTTLESAIPEHLHTERTCPMRMKQNWAPPYPSYSARFDTTATHIGIVVLGLQFCASTTSELQQTLRARMRETLQNNTCVRHNDEVVFTDSAEFTNYAFITYFDADQSSRNAANDLVNSWLTDPDADKDIGLYTEQAWPDLRRVETLYSSAHIQGVAHIADNGLSGEIQEHGYWGSTSDRMPAAQTDTLPGTRGHVENGDHSIRAVKFDNLCMIRSGQDFQETEGDERAMYLNEVEPTLKEGMDFLTHEGRSIGCLTNRYAQVVRPDGSLADQTFGMSWWDSLEHLNSWAKDHPTHKAIFAQAMDYLNKHGGSGHLKLTHEVFVMESGEAKFEYVRCHPDTGLIGL